MPRHRVGFTGIKIKIRYPNQITTNLDGLIWIESDQKKKRRDGRVCSKVAQTHEHP